MAIGLAAATQSYFIGAAGSLMLACVMIGTKKRVAKQAAMLMVIRGSHTDLDKMQELVKEQTESVKIRAKIFWQSLLRLFMRYSFMKKEAIKS